MPRLLFLTLLGLTAIEALVCPNPQYSCPDSSTCCLLADGEYGCCPMPSAVCCEDQIHCCPSGSSCEIAEGTCNGPFTSTPLVRKEAAVKNWISSNDNVCPDDRTKCPSETTCCQMQSGAYGCCPAPNAICCADKMHCCPSGFRCDSTGERCKRNGSPFTMKWLTKFPASPIVMKDTIDYVFPVKVESHHEKRKHPVACGNGFGCGKKSTCCLAYDDEDGPYAEYACCPLSNAQCCGHGCCPHGFECSADGRSCDKRAKTAASFAAGGFKRH